ncbi:MULTISPECIES: hypothetical protein [Cyanophyceae]|uniref:hypothetical protein n=1 Tax=Cyanophyceae TaxID=3028117 RepID=UPI00168653DA|nr:hypothetical protein [Trichocoleus sp. FACHB-832]
MPKETKIIRDCSSLGIKPFSTALYLRFVTESVSQRLAAEEKSSGSKCFRRSRRQAPTLVKTGWF